MLPKTSWRAMLALFSFSLFFQNSPLLAQPLDDITNRSVVGEKPPLAYDMPHERDILWQKRLWRVLDAREKINLPFLYPDAPFFDILTKAAEAGEITLYAGDKDDFSEPLSGEDLNRILFRTDTLEIFNPDQYETTLTVVQTSINWEDVKRFRIKEMWYFDTRTSTMRVRILGIAPMLERFTESGDFIGEVPLFWLHYPTSREVLAQELVFNGGNEASRMTWEDLFEMRLFSSYIYKEANVRDNRLQDLYTGVDLLLEADKIKQEVFNFEHDLWEY